MGVIRYLKNKDLKMKASVKKEAEKLINEYDLNCTIEEIYDNQEFSELIS